MSDSARSIRTTSRRTRLRLGWLRDLRRSETALLILCMTWLLGTIAGFLWGPFKYEIPNRLELYVYLAAVHAAFVTGFLLGARHTVRPYAFPARPPTILRICVILSAIYFAVMIATTPGGLIGSIRAALQDPDAARTIFINQLGSWTDYLGLVMAPFTSAIIPLGIFYWRFARTPERVFVLFWGLLTVLRSVATASRHGTWFLMIMLGGVLVAAHYARMIRIPKLAVTIAGAAAITGFVFYSNFIATSRVPIGAPQEFAWALNADWIDVDNPIYEMPPESIRPGILQGFVYFTHGYRGLALAMEQPYRGTTFGFGNSMFLTRNFARLTGSDMIYKRSLPYRLLEEAGYEPTWWMTAYPWLATDVTFPGSVLLVGIIAWLMVAAYRDAVLMRNPFAVLSFTWLLYTVISFPQGSVTQDGGVLLSFVGALALWFVSRKHARSPVRRPMPAESAAHA